MGIDIGGNTIGRNGSAGISLNSLGFNAAGQGSANPTPGYTGWKAGTTYYSAPSGWETSAVQWQANLNTGNGIFTCPVAGFYAIGYNSIHNGGSGWNGNTYGYSGFGKNGALSYFVHWNLDSRNGWCTGGTSALFQCAAGDTLALFVNRAPAPTSPDGIAQNMGMYPSQHHAVWCKLIG
jgi:hypothetical protein